MVVVNGEHTQPRWEGVHGHLFPCMENIHDQFQESKRRLPNPRKEPKKTVTFLPATMDSIQEPPGFRLRTTGEQQR
jgi:hypothetical protein